MTLFALSFVFLVALAGFTSASHPYNTYTYSDRDAFSYNENNNGFRIASDDSYRTTNVRGYTYCGYYDWSYGGRKCAHSLANRPYYPDHAFYGDYDKDAAIKDAFRTYRDSKKYDYQIKIKEYDQEIRLKELELEDRYRRDRFRHSGYGYGYTHYSYGW